MRWLESWNGKKGGILRKVKRMGCSDGEKGGVYLDGEKGGKSGTVIGWIVEMVKSVSCWDGEKGWMVI